MPRQTFNPYQRAARLVKTQALADVLFGADLTADIVRRLTAAEWKQVAHLAGVEPPHSDETINLVAEAVEAREQAQAMWAGRDVLERFSQ